MNATLKFALGAVAVTVIALGSLQLIGTANIGGPGPAPLSSPSPAPTGSLSSESTPAPAPSCDSDIIAADEVPTGPLDPGTYTCYGVGGGELNAKFTVPAGWEWHGSFLSKGGLDSPEEARISFFRGDIQVYADPCHWSAPTPDARTGLAVSHLMDALAAQPMRNTTTPVARSGNPRGPGADWRGAMAIELAVPDDISFADCDRGQFRSWGPEDNVRSHQAPGQHDLVWAVDVYGGLLTTPPSAGDRLVFDASWLPGTPVDVLSEIDAILKSMNVGGWG